MSDTSNKKPNRREAMREKRRAQKRNRQMTWIVLGGGGGLIIAGALIFGLLNFGSNTIATSDYSREWQEFPDEGAEHKEPGEPHEPYQTNPPTSGPHSAVPAKSGFYATLDSAPIDENIVHSLEHGYVVVWYNCDDLSDEDCDTLSSDVEGLVNKLGLKVLGVPRSGIGGQVVLTSWLWMDEMPEFNEERIRAYVAGHRSRPPAPEANVVGE